MLDKTEAIVLGSVKYGDSSLILKCYTPQQGLISFIAGGARSKKGPVKLSMVQPLSQLEIVYYDRSKGELKRIKEAGMLCNYQSILYDPVKNCLVLFMAEVLRHILHEGETNPALFDFLKKALIWLDKKDSPPANFHLLTLYHMTSYLGFEPEEAREKIPLPYFDLMNGSYSKFDPGHTHVISGHLLEHWRLLSQLEFEKLKDYKPGSKTRAALLDEILIYYRLHVKDFGELRSLEVIRSVLHGD